MNMKRCGQVAACVWVWVLGTGNIWAWGERGHDAITRVAVRIVSKSDPQGLGALLLTKAHMMAHLSNVPDIVWRNVGKEIASQNRPTHFIDLEYIWAEKTLPQLSQLPPSYKLYQQRIMAQCKIKQNPCPKGDSMERKASQAGHAPFRVAQLVNLAISTGKRIKLLQDQKKAPHRKLKQEGLQFLTYLGVLSHFVGDLGNPHHTTMDYDGKLTGQGGLHSYFESQVVRALGLDLEHEVLDYILKSKPYLFIQSEYKPQSPLEMIYALALDSHRRLESLRELDRKHSLIEQSWTSAAKRRSADTVKEHYREFVIQRLGAAADTLAQFWLAIQKESGKPGWAYYRSYDYPLKPDFISVDYASD